MFNIFNYILFLLHYLLLLLHTSLALKFKAQYFQRQIKHTLYYQNFNHVFCVWRIPPLSTSLKGD